MQAPPPLITGGIPLECTATIILLIRAVVHNCLLFTGLQYSLPALVTGMASRGIPLERTAAIWAAAPAKLATLLTRKGRLAAGFDADVVVSTHQCMARVGTVGRSRREKGLAAVLVMDEPLRKPCSKDGSARSCSTMSNASHRSPDSTPHAFPNPGVGPRGSSGHDYRGAVPPARSEQSSPPHNFDFPTSPQVWDPAAAADTTAEGLHHKHKATPYVGTQLRGRVLATFVRGQQVFAAGRDFPAKPCGGLILRK